MKEKLSGKNSGIFEGGPFAIFFYPLLSLHFQKKREREKTGLNYRIRLNEYIKRRSILHSVITMLIWIPAARDVLWLSPVEGGTTYLSVYVSFTIYECFLFIYLFLFVFC